MFSARQLHQALRREIGPTLASLGFRQLRTSLAAWTKPNPGPTTLWFQCDKYGWDHDWGSQFTLELQQGEPSAPGAGDIASRVRYWRLLGDNERMDALTRNNSVIRALPGTLRNAVVTVRDDEGQDIVIVGYREHHGLPPPGADIWMHYYREQDVVDWTDFLKARMSSAVERFEGRSEA